MTSHSHHYLRTAVFVLTICAVALAALLATTQPSFASPIDYFNTALGPAAGLPTDSPTDIALNIMAAFLSLIGLIDVCIIIYAGFVLVTSQGNPEKVKQGRDTITWAIIGSIIILSSLGIVLYLDKFIFGAH